MKLKCIFNLEFRSSFAETIDWFMSIGVDWITWEAIANSEENLVIEVELMDTPAILQIYSDLQKYIEIAKITSQGISFYLTDVVLNKGREVEDNPFPIISDNKDGIIFCPMSNVKAINTFGSLKPQ